MGVARTCEFDTLAVRLDLGNELLRKFDGTAADVGHLDPVERVERRIQHRHLDDRRRANAHPADALAGSVVEIEGERRGVPEPARQSRANLIDQVGPDMDKTGGAGSAIEVFVGAADGDVGVAGSQIDRQCAGRMRQVPDHHCPG